MNLLDFLPCDVTSGSFDTACRNASFKIETTLLSYLSTLKVKTVEEMEDYFIDKELDSNTICAKKMIDVGGWRCADCVRNDNTIFCQDCWSRMKEKHKDHNIIFLNKVNGTCDCGDHNCINQKYFCSKHIGIFEKDEDIKSYINDSLGASLASKLKTTNQTMFNMMNEFYIRAINEKKTNSKGFLKVVNEFINCFGILCDMSTACSFLISDLLLKNYFNKVKHTCLDIDVTTNKGKIIKSSFFAHDCTCPFIRFLMEFWPGKKQKLIYKLLNNYKLKKLIGLYYFLFYNENIKNCILDFHDLSVQIIFTDVLRIACGIPGLIENMYVGFIEIFNIFINKDSNFSLTGPLLNLTISLLSKEKKFTFMKEIIYKLRCDTIYSLKPSSIYYLSNNTEIIFKLIDMTSLLHNINSIKVIFPPPPTNQGEKYILEILDVEIWLLDILSLYISIFNFDDNNLVKEVFTYFSKVIQKKIKNELKDDEYSFHISLYRAFSIFLNRYCFHEANKTNSNILKSLQNVHKLMPDFQKCSREMIKSIYKVFGFITACEEGFFVYYGESMAKYEYLYYFNREFIYRDFCLLKYLLALKENAKYLGFNEILKLCQVENSHKPIENYILTEKVTSPSIWMNNWNRQYLKFSSKILFIILSLLRNNTCLLWNLSCAYQMMKSNKMEDKLISNILQKDINNFLELTKELVINQILIKENLAYFTEITDNIFLCLSDFFGEKNVSDIIISLTNKTLTKEKKAKFSLKDELLYYIDLNYIIYPIYKSKAEKYISDFKSKLVSIFNIHFYPVNKFEQKLTDENYNQLYFNEKNFDFLFHFTSLILTQKGYEVLNEYFLSVLLNYLSTFLCVESDHFVFLRENLKTNHILEVLEKNNLNDEVKKSYCKFIVEKIREQNTTDTLELNQNTNKIMEAKEEPRPSVINVQPVNKSSKMSMKEKMKNKFKKKNNNLSDKLGVDKIVVEEVSKNTESCIYCRKPIVEDDITKPYGVIGDFMCDNYTSNAFFQAIRKEYKKHYDKDLNLPDFDLIYYQPLDRKSIRIISCNHYIHFPCYFKQFMESDLLTSLSIFSCPLCNRLSETCVPMLVQYTDEQTKGYFKGFDFNYVFEYGKGHIEEYVKKLEEAKNKEVEEKSEDEEEKEKEGKKEEKKDEIKIDLKGEIKEEKKEINQEAENFRKEYPDFVNICKHFIEGFVGIKAGVGSVDIEDKFIKPVMGKFSTALGIQYRDLFTYLDNVEEKKSYVILWENFLLSMRLMMKLDIVKKEDYFLRLYKMLKEFITFKFDFEIEAIIQLDNVKLRTCEMCLLFSFFFNYDEIEGYEKYIMYMVMPIYAFGFFLKSIYFLTSFGFNKEEFLKHLNSEELYKFLNEDKTLNLIITQVAKELAYTKIIMNKNIDIDKLSLELNDNLDLLNLPSLKNKSLLEILDELDKLIEADATNDKNKHLYQYLKPNNNYKEVFDLILNSHIVASKNEKCDKVLSPSLFGSCLPCIFKFIDLPELAIDFEYESYNKICQVCKAKGKRALICLDCGRKVCDSRSCLTTFNGEEVPGFIAHCKICGGGRTAYLQSDDCSVLFISNKAVFRKFIPLYVNEFGEGISKANFGKEFKLNKEEVKKALKMFTEYSYSNAEIIT